MDSSRRRTAQNVLGVTLVVQLYFAVGVLMYWPGRGEHYVIATTVDNSGPFVYETTDGLGGFDIDLMETIAEDRGFTVTFEPMEFDEALAALDADEVDGVMAAVKITAEREERFDFSTPYLWYSTALLAPYGEHGIASYEDLRGSAVGVPADTPIADFAESIQDEYGFVPVHFDDFESMLAAIHTGAVRAFFVERIYPRSPVPTWTDATSVLAGEPGRVALAVNDGRNGELLESFNNGLNNLEDDYVELTERDLGQKYALPGDSNYQLKFLAFTAFINSWWIVPYLALGVRAVWVKLRPSRAARTPGADELQDAL